MASSSITRHSRKLNPRTLLSLAVAVIIGISIGLALKAKADSYAEGQSISLPTNWKLVSIQMQGKKPMALIRQMRGDEHPEVWIFKPLEDLTASESELGSEPGIAIRESTDRIKKTQ